MKTMTLVRQNHEQPDMEYLRQMRDYFENMIESQEQFTTEDWVAVLEQLALFQDKDGSFNLLDSYQIESDCAIYYCYEPTYIGTALLIQAFLLHPEIFTKQEEAVLQKAMHASCARELNGHGFDWLRDMIKAIKYFASCDVMYFLENWPDFCKEFRLMFEDIREMFYDLKDRQQFCNEHGEDYTEDILDICFYFSAHVIFVYGTLMKGEANHKRYMANCPFQGNGKIDGFAMYDLGFYPGIVAGDGTVYGEVYAVSAMELRAINQLEGEGVLYTRKNVMVTMDSGKRMGASVYVYNGDVSDAKRLYKKYGEGEYVWYVSYGSNMLEDRLRYYIQGGLCHYNHRAYKPCTDISMPRESRPVMIPYDMYYANYDMGSWRNSAVSFLDLSEEGCSYGRAYKIKRSQLEEIHEKEGKGANWYPECIRLEDIDGLEAYTFAGHDVKKKESLERVSAEYALTLFMGMRETYPQMSDEDIYDYLSTLIAY